MSQITGGPLSTLLAAAAKFREYEAHHNREADTLLRGTALSPAEMDALAHGRREKAAVNCRMAEACERAAQELEELIAAAGARAAPKPAPDRTKAGFSAGFEAGKLRGQYEILRDAETVESTPAPDLDQAWGFFIANLATGRVEDAG